VKIRPVVWVLVKLYHCWAVITNTNLASVVIKAVLKICNHHSQEKAPSSLQALPLPYENISYDDAFENISSAKFHSKEERKKT